MMLCKADFEEIFPELFKPQEPPVLPAAANNPACIARWEDDGGMPNDHAYRHDAPAAHAASDDYVVQHLISTSFALATIPAVSVFDAARTMLGGFDQTAKPNPLLQ